MKLVEQLEKLSADRKAQAAATYQTILLRSSEPQAADAQLLADDILAVLGLTPADVQADEAAIAKLAGMLLESQDTPPARWSHLTRLADHMAAHPRIWDASEAGTIRPKRSRPEFIATRVIGSAKNWISTTGMPQTWSYKFIAIDGEMRKVTKVDHEQSLFGQPPVSRFYFDPPFTVDVSVYTHFTIFCDDENLMQFTPAEPEKNAQ